MKIPKHQTVKLTDDELDISLNFIERNGSSFLFPQPFEIDAIRSCWEYIRPLLQEIDLLSYNPLEVCKILAPKHAYTVRVAHLLNPIDTILFTGLVYRIAPQLEQKRKSIADDRVFSMRFELIDKKGNFTLKNDWDGMIKVVETKSSEYEMVVQADIADFFPRIYLHRLKNIIDGICDLKYEKRALIRFYESNNWCDGTSYGIPVGPLGTNLLAEVLLTDIDDFLLSINADFVRYIDDYLIFTDTKSDCVKILFQLGERLNYYHLGLNMAKTKPATTEMLLKQLVNPEDSDKQLRKNIIQVVFKGDPYKSVVYEELSPTEQELIDKIDVKVTIEEAFKSELTDFSSLRFILNILSALRRPEIAEIILENLDRLYPISSAVAKFFSVFDEIDEEIRYSIGQRILKYLTETSYVPDYQSLWLLQPFVISNKWNNVMELRRMAKNHSNPMVRRQAMLAMGMIGERSSLIDVRTKYHYQCDDWESRAIVYACRNLPEDERKAFYSSLKIEKNWTYDNCLLKSTLEYAIKTKNH